MERTRERERCGGAWAAGLSLLSLALRTHMLPCLFPLPSVRVNEADAFADEENQDEYFDFEDVAEI